MGGGGRGSHKFSHDLNKKLIKPSMDIQGTPWDPYTVRINK